MRAALPLFQLSSSKSGPDVVRTVGPLVTRTAGAETPRRHVVYSPAALSLVSSVLGSAGRAMLAHPRPALLFERLFDSQIIEIRGGSQAEFAVCPGYSVPVIPPSIASAPSLTEKICLRRRKSSGAISSIPPAGAETYCATRS